MLAVEKDMLEQLTEIFCHLQMICVWFIKNNIYYNVANAQQQLSSLSNVHYHANVQCPKAHFAKFDPCAVQVRT